MANVKIIGKKGSQSRKDISANTAVKLYTGQKNVDIIVNYGMTGKKLMDFFKKYPSARNIPIINKIVGHSKYQVIEKAKQLGIRVPESLTSLPKTAILSEWIEKRINSSQGKGIIRAKNRNEIAGKYYQRMVKDRKFELRVHAFSWIRPEEWVIHKRFGPKNQIVWNFHQGGHFQQVRYTNDHKVFSIARDCSKKILNMLGMSFGAVDFIVDENNNVYSIEINSSPGFTQLSERVYYNAMTQLTEMPVKEVLKYGE